MTRSHPIGVCLALAALLAGCGDGGTTQLRTREATSEVPAQAPQAGDRDAVKAVRRQALARIDEVRKAAFERGVDYVLHGLDVAPGQDYAIAFKQGRRGYFVKDSLPMKPGLAYECLPQTRYCTAQQSTTAVPSATAAPAPTDPCEPSYPNVCLDPSAADYDCAGGGEDGPEYVDGRVVITGSDPFDLDGYPRDGVGCATR